MSGNHRVRKYEATTYYTSTGSTHTSQYAFTQAQADEVGGVLEPDGLNIVLAQKLCDNWTKRGGRSSVRYSYRIPFVASKSAEELL